MKQIHIIGTGLIGGSFAMAIKARYPHGQILGTDQNETHLEEAIALQWIDGKADYDALHRADLVILSIPVDAAVQELPKILEAISDTTLVMDVGSTKFPICKAVKDHPRRRNFLATHPIAGTEFSGPRAAVPDLYEHKTMIICEVEKTAFKLQEQALKLISDLGMRVRYMSPEAHDKHIAYVSHLSHISAFMLGKTVMEKEKDERDIFDMAGSGFESTVRLAKSSPAMWAPIFKQNKTNVLETLEEYIQNLAQFKQMLEQDDYGAIFGAMQSTNHIRAILDGINGYELKQ